MDDLKNAEFGYVFLSDEEEAKYLGMAVKTIKKYHASLIEKGFLEIVEIDNKKVKKFNLKKLAGQ